MDSMYGRTPPGRGRRWACPNDRELALRAQVRTGWSVKTESFESRYADFAYSSSYPGNLNSTPSTSTPYALTDEEKDTILEVVRRAEAQDVAEEERIGLLVERLNNIKKNVHTVTAARSSTRTCGSRCSKGCVCSCALCGEKFAVLGAGPSLCHDCRKYICQKCGIETSPSVAMTPGSSASSAGTSSSTPQPHSSTSSVSLHLLLKSSRDNTNKRFLCRICAETREMWKQSNAWFYHGLPKHILPEKKDRGRSRSGARSLGWSTAGATRSLEPSEQDSSSDDEAGRSGRMTRTRSLLSANCDVEVARGEGATTSAGAPWLGVRSNSSASVERRLSNGAENSQNASNRRSSSTSSATSRSKSAANAQRGRRSTIGDERKPNLLTTDGMSGSQVHHRSASSLSINNGSSRRSSSTVVSGASSMTSVSSLRDHYPSSSYHNSLDQLPWTDRTGPTEKSMGYGTLEISLRYIPWSQCLQCRVLRARNLRGMDLEDLSDPFCKLNILPMANNSTATFQRTKTVHRTRDPEFNEQLSFFETTESDMKSGRALHVLILQDDRVGRDFLGEARFPLYEVPSNQTRFYKVYLEDHYQVSQEEKVWGEDSTNGRGQIQLTLSYNTRRRALLVTVERATDLLPMDNNGFSDPFVKLCLTKEPSKVSTSEPVHRFGALSQIMKTGEKSARKLCRKKKNPNAHSTSVKRKTLNPEWNEEFAFETQLTDLSGLALLIWVWDKDLGKSNDYLGGLTLSCNSTGARLRQWVDAMKFPDHSHQATHNLIEDFIPPE